MACGGIHRPHRWLHRPWRTPPRPTARNLYVRSHDHPNQYIEQLLLSIAQRDRGVPLSKHELIGRRCLSDPCHTPGLRGADRWLGVFWWRRKPNPVGLKCQRCVEPHRGWHAWLDGRRVPSPDGICGAHRNILSERESDCPQTMPVYCVPRSARRRGCLRVASTPEVPISTQVQAEAPSFWRCVLYRLDDAVRRLGCGRRRP
jgi:hypothetical protein